MQSIKNIRRGSLSRSKDPTENEVRPITPSRITTDCRGSLWAIYGDGDDRQRDIRKPDSGGSSATPTGVRSWEEPPRFPNSLTYGRIYWRR